MVTRVARPLRLVVEVVLIGLGLDYLQGGVSPADSGPSRGPDSTGAPAPPASAGRGRRRRVPSGAP